MEEIQHEVSTNKGSFFINELGKKVAVLEYKKIDESEIVIDHTHVSDVLKGKGAGKLLVNAAVSWARENQIKIIPQCSFALAVIQKDATLQDVL